MLELGNFEKIIKSVKKIQNQITYTRSPTATTVKL